MKTVSFLMIQRGEFHYTPRNILEPYIGQEYDREAMAGTILSNDDWRAHPKKLYDLQDIEIPEWMTPKEYVTYSHNWIWYKKIGGTEELGKKVFIKISSIKDGALRLASLQLLKTKRFKSELRKSFQKQLISWIEDKNSKYDNPFSQKQSSILCNSYVRMEAIRIGVAA